MKIQATRTSNPAVASEREPTGRGERVTQHFAAELTNQTDDQYRERLTALLQKIDEQGEKLGKVPTFADLKEYRNLVRQFLGETVNRAFLLESRMGWDGRGRQKVFSTIRKVDNELAGLAEEMRTGQSAQLKILGRLDSIRGLLVELYS